MYEPTRNYPDIWAFCLYSHKMRFFFLSQFKSQLTHSSNNIPLPVIRISISNQLLNSDSSFWLAFDRRPTFVDKLFNNEIEPKEDDSPNVTNNKIEPKINDPLIVTNMTIIDHIKFRRSVRVVFSYGALTSMNEYYFHPDYYFWKQTDWNVRFSNQKKKQQRQFNVK